MALNSYDYSNIEEIESIADEYLQAAWQNLWIWKQGKYKWKIGFVTLEVTPYWNKATAIPLALDGGLR